MILDALLLLFVAWLLIEFGERAGGFWRPQWRRSINLFGWLGRAVFVLLAASMAAGVTQ